MENKRNFIKRERSNDKKIPVVKETYRGTAWMNGTDENTNNNVNNHKRKDEPFVLMFRDFIFFVRNLVDGIVLKRYFRMGSDDQLPVFKNRHEFDEFMKKEFILDRYIPVRDPNTGDIVSITSTWDGESFTYEDNPLFFDMVAKVFEEDRIKLEHYGGNGMKWGKNIGLQ